MATRLQILEDKSKSIETKALVLHEMVCKSIHNKVENGCPSRCETCLEAIKECLEEEVGEDFGN